MCVSTRPRMHPSKPAAMRRATGQSSMQTRESLRLPCGASTMSVKTTTRSAFSIVIPSRPPPAAEDQSVECLSSARDSGKAREPARGSLFRADFPHSDGGSLGGGGLYRPDLPLVLKEALEEPSRVVVAEVCWSYCPSRRRHAQRTELGSSASRSTFCLSLAFRSRKVTRMRSLHRARNL